MSERVYEETDEPCPACGGEVLIDVDYDDVFSGLPPTRTVHGYDCQETECGRMYNPREWIEAHRQSR